jgi:hypothetical protein
MELTLRIFLEKPPSGVDFALQKGRGSFYETVQKQRSKAKDLRFEFTVEVKDNTKDGLPDFQGGYVQGPPGGRFVYIDIGTYAGQAGCEWSRKLKIPLAGITQKMIEILSAEPSAALETRVPGTGKDGGPNCATVKPFPGWEVV